MYELKELIKLVKHKHKIDLKREEPKYMNNEWLLNAIASELQEVKDEIKEKNVAHLEDELSDILWGWMTLVENLKGEGYVVSHEAIIKRGLKKYQERILPLYGDERDYNLWKETKLKQKEMLIRERDIRLFQDDVREFYKSFYADGDKAHLVDHADEVCDLALNINRDLDEKLIVLASYMHDMFNSTNRAIHHQLAYEYVLKAKDKFLKKLSKKELKELAYAVLEHRGSFQGEFYSSLSAIISSADRGLPDLSSIVIRSMKFNQGNAEAVFSHIKAKYGTHGYAKYPDVYQSIFKKELKAFKNLVNTLEVEQVIKIWKAYKSPA